MKLVPERLRHDLRRVAFWLFVGAIAVAGVGAGVGSVIYGWTQSVRDTQEVADASETTQRFYESAMAEFDADPGHERFTLDQFAIRDRGPDDERPARSDEKRRARIEGAWSWTTTPSNVVDDFYWKDCPYAIGPMNVTLRESDGRVFGFGDFRLSTANCPDGENDLIVYASVTGTLIGQYLKFTVRDGRNGAPHFTFFGTVRPEGVLGQARSTNNELLLENVVLQRR